MGSRRSGRSANPSCREIAEECDEFFRHYDMQTFSVPVPMTAGNSGSQNKEGIKQKILKNRSTVVTTYNSKQSIIDGGSQPISDEECTEVLGAVEELTAWLLHPSADSDAERRKRPFPFSGTMASWGEDCERGSIVIVAERSDVESDSTEPKWRPVGGGVITWKESEPDERKLNAIWCRRSLDSELVENQFVQYLCLRLMAAAFYLEVDPDNKKKSTTDRLVSILDVLMKIFPNDAVKFLTDQENGIGLGAHIEEPGHGGSHTANPKLKCACRTVKHPQAWKFWGTNEARFREFCKKTFDARAEALALKAAESKIKNWSHREQSGRERRSLQPTLTYDASPATKRRKERAEV